MEELGYTEKKFHQVFNDETYYFFVPDISSEVSLLSLDIQDQIFRRWFSDSLFCISNDLLISINTQNVDMILKNLRDLESILDTLNAHNNSFNHNK